MPRKKTGKQDKAQSLAQSHLPAMDTVLPTEQAKAEHANANNRTNDRKEEQRIATIFVPSTFSVWMQTWLPIVFSGLVVIVIVVQAFIYKKQWDVMREQSNLLNASIQEATKTREVENRAYVGIKEITMNATVKSKKDIEIILTIENTGKTPARASKLTSVAHGFFRQDRLIPRESLVTQYYAPTQFELLAGNSHPASIPIKALTDEAYKIVANTEQRLYIWGRVEYDDVFGKSHWTPFCFVNVSNTDGAFFGCTSDTSFGPEPDQGERTR